MFIKLYRSENTEEYKVCKTTEIQYNYRQFRWLDKTEACKSLKA